MAPKIVINTCQGSTSQIFFFFFKLVCQGVCMKHYQFYFILSIINNYSPKWRWLAVDIYRAAKRRGKYPALATDTEVNSCFSIYNNYSMSPSWI